MCRSGSRTGERNGGSVRRRWDVTRRIFCRRDTTPSAPPTAPTIRRTPSPPCLGPPVLTTCHGGWSVLPSSPPSSPLSSCPPPCTSLIRRKGRWARSCPLPFSPPCFPLLLRVQISPGLLFNLLPHRRRRCPERLPIRRRRPRHRTSPSPPRPL